MESIHQRLVLASRRDELDAASAVLMAALERVGYDSASAFAVRLALEEALTNAVKHGNRDNPSRNVTLEFDVNAHEAVIDVLDQGEGFDPGAVPDPTAAENLDIPSGRGLMLMRSFMASVEVHPPGNHVTLRFRR